MANNLKNNVIQASRLFGTLAIAAAVTGCATTQGPGAGSIDYNAASPAYSSIENQRFPGPAQPQPYGRGTYRQQWTNYTVVDPRTGNTMSFPGCYNIIRENYIDADGTVKIRDRFLSLAAGKNETMCKLTNPLSGVIGELPPATPQRRYGY